MARVRRLAPALAFGSIASACAAQVPGADEVTVAELEVPAPEAGAARASAPLDRSGVRDGILVAAIEARTSHGCSRSYATMTTTGTATLMLRSGRVEVTLDLLEQTLISSPTAPYEPHRTDTSSKALLAGDAAQGEAPGSFTAKLAVRSCEGRCPKGPIELRCAARRIPLDHRPAADALPGSAGAVDGIVCAWEGELPGLSASYDFSELPFAPGDGVVAHKSSGDLDEQLRVYAAAKAP
jgi:hypothetical protein